MDNLMTMLAEKSENRPIAEVAAECDIVFADRHANSGLEIPGYEIVICENSFREAIDAAKKGKTAMFVLGEFFSVVYPDARLARSVRIYQAIFEGR